MLIRKSSSTQPLTLFLREFPVPWEILLSLFLIWIFWKIKSLKKKKKKKKIKVTVCYFISNYELHVTNLFGVRNCLPAPQKQLPVQSTLGIACIPTGIKGKTAESEISHFWGLLRRYQANIFVLGINCFFRMLSGSSENVDLLIIASNF